MNNDFEEKVEPGEIYHPFRNPRLIPYLRGNALSETSYGALSTDVDTNNNDRAYRYQTLAADLLLNGAFNINSTSVDAWVSHLSSLKGREIPNRGKTAETPVPRFLKEREVINFNAWDKIRSSQMMKSAFWHTVLLSKSSCAVPFFLMLTLLIDV